jgi:multidrug efflux pump subunit AcrB
MPVLYHDAVVVVDVVAVHAVMLAVFSRLPTAFVDESRCAFFFIQIRLVNQLTAAVAFEIVKYLFVNHSF